MRRPFQNGRDTRIFYGWFVLAACFFCLFLSTGARNGFGVFILPMSEEFDWSRGTISLALAIGWLANGISQPFIGRLYDRLGGRSIMSVSLLVLGCCTVLLSQTSSIWFLIVVFGFVMSIASGGASMVTIHGILSKWFYRKRGVVLSISTAGASAGSLVLVPFTSYLILLVEWRAAWLVLGLLVLVLALPLALLLIRDDPAQMGEVADGDAAPPSTTGDRRPPTSRTGPLDADSWRESYRSQPIWQLTAAYFVCGMTTAIISVHYVPFAVERGLSPSVAALAFGTMSGLNVLGVIAVGFASDKMKRKYLLGSVYAVRGLAYVMLILGPGTIGLWGFALIAGFSWIATAPLTSSLTADIYGLRAIGTLNGMTNFAHQMGGALSIYMAGVLYDLLGAYDVPFAISGALLVGASLASFSIMEKQYSVRYQPAPVPAVAVGSA